jgi:hypothetical protein
MSKTRLIHKAIQIPPSANKDFTTRLNKSQIEELKELRQKYRDGSLASSRGAQPSQAALCNLVCEEFKIKIARSTFREWMRKCD